MQQQQPQLEHVLRGPVSIAPGGGEIARNIIVAIGVNIFRIPLPAQGCQELSQALALSDEELTQAAKQQQRASDLVLPNGATA